MHLLKIGKVNFPSPTNIKINMMPFIIGDKHLFPKNIDIIIL